jgi:hypothetical protein
MQPYARVDFIPQLGTKNFASGVRVRVHSHENALLCVLRSI